MSDTIDLRYPIGKLADQPYASRLDPDDKIKEELLLNIQMLPQALEYAIVNLDADQLDTPYRPGGWTVQQVVHHVAASHMNAYVRFKLGLTETNPPSNPTMKPAGPNSAILKRCRSICLSRCCMPCMRGGLRC